MRACWIVAFVMLAGCSSAPVETKKTDPTQEPWYNQTVEQLARMDRDAEAAFKAGKRDDAAKLITDSEPLANRLLSAPQPTLPAMEAVADREDLYARMLLSNRHYAWARTLFQKNLARWKHWEPKTPETEERRKHAEAEIADCDRQMAQ